MFRKILAVAVVAALAIVPSCSKVKDTVEDAAKGKIEKGAWNEDNTVFTNSWSNIKLTLPDGYYVATREEIDQMLGESQEIFEENDIMDESQYDAASLKTWQDFVVAGSETGVPQLQCTYENLALSASTKQVTDEDYWNIAKEQFTAVESFGFNELESSTATIGGEEFFVGKGEFNNGTVKIDGYIRKQDDVVISLMMTYTSDDEAKAAELIGAISAAK
jgi:hypothetical protein